MLVHKEVEGYATSLKSKAWAYIKRADMPSFITLGQNLGNGFTLRRYLDAQDFFWTIFVKGESG
jgi:hypothetical protein